MCTIIYVVVGVVLTGMVPVHRSWRWPTRWRAALEMAGFTRVGWIVALGAAVSMATVLLVFQYGQPGSSSPWRATGCSRSGRRGSMRGRAFPAVTTLITGVLVALASLVGDAAETYDLTNIGTLFAFALVCAGRDGAARHGAGSAAALQGAVRLGRLRRWASWRACS